MIIKKLYIFFILIILSKIILFSDEINLPQLVLDTDGHKSFIGKMAFTNDEKYLITGSQDKLVKVWDIKTGECMKTLRGYRKGQDQGKIFCIALSPGDKYLAVGGWFKGEKAGDKGIGAIRIYDFSSGELIKLLKSHDSVVVDLEFSYDGKYLISSSFDTNVIVWDVLNDFGILHKLEYHKKEVYGISISHNNRYIATSSFDNSIALWELSTGKLIKYVENAHSGGVEQIDFSLDDRYLATSSAADGTIKLFNAKDLSFVKIINKTSAGYSNTKIEFSNDGKYLLFGGLSPEFYGGKYICPVYFYNLKKGKIEKKFYNHDNTITAIANSRSGKYVASSGGNNNEVFIYKEDDFKNPIKLISRGKTIFEIAYGNDNKTIYFGNTNISDRYLNENPIERSFSLLDFSISTNPDNNYTKFYKVINGKSFDFKGGLFNKTIKIGDKTVILDRQYDTIRAFTFTPDGKYAIIGSDNALTKVDAETGFKLEEFSGHERLIWAVSVSNDSKRMISGSWDQTIKLWEIDNTPLEFIIYSVQESSLADKSGLKIGDIIYNIDGKIFKSHLEFLNYIKTKTKYDFYIRRDDENIKIKVNKTTDTFGFTFLARSTPLATIFISNDNEYLIWTPDNYFTGNKKLFKYVGWHLNQGEDKEAKFYSFDQFALKYNRPDIILQRIGFASKEVINAYYQIYKNRIKKLGFDEKDLSGELHLPEVQFKSNITGNNTDSKTIKLTISAEDSLYNLDRINVFINDVPVYGIKGIDIKSKKRKKYSTDVALYLIYGKNKIQVSCLNEKGVESFKETLNIFCNKKQIKPDLYIATIGVSNYKDREYNLKYSEKDAKDLINTYKNNTKLYNQVKILELNNEKATKANILKIKDFFNQGKIDDHVILFIAGHGIRDDNNEYYFATYDIDFDNPSKNGFNFNELDSLLDGIPSITKMLLMDTCFSGELEEGYTDAKRQSNKKLEGKVISRGFKNGVKTVSAESKKQLLLLQKDIFTNLKLGTGAVVITSSSGTEFSYEGRSSNGEVIKNGIFTYCFLSGLKNYESDLNKDRKIQISEIMNWVYDKVIDLTDGWQTPTLRREKLEFDYTIF